MGRPLADVVWLAGKILAQAIRVPLLWMTSDRPTIVVASPVNLSCLSIYFKCKSPFGVTSKFPCFPTQREKGTCVNLIEKALIHTHHIVSK